MHKTVVGLPKSDCPVTTHVLSLTERETIEALPNAALNKHPSIKLVINNAGMAVGGDFIQVSEEDFNWLMEINSTS